MCTVTFIPTSSTSYIFTSSRDERYDRDETIFPQKSNIETDLIIFPQDLEAKGTWFAASKNRLACLLNGAFLKHKRKSKYKKSRGLMLLDSFKYSSIEEFIHEYSFQEMEPFTLILIQNIPFQLVELRWDESNLSVKNLAPDKKHIWSSSTLYEPHIIEEREKWFEKWHQKGGDKLEISRDFHYKAGAEDHHNSVLLKRESKGTISITSLVYSKEKHEMIYDDFKNGIKKVNLNHAFQTL